METQMQELPALARQSEKDTARAKFDTIVVTTAYAYYSGEVYMGGNWYFLDWKQPVSTTPREGHRAFRAHARNGSGEKVVYVDTDRNRMLNTAYMLAEIMRDRGAIFIWDVYGQGRGSVTVKPDGTIVPPKRRNA